jgi:hypothetical protein
MLQCLQLQHERLKQQQQHQQRLAPQLLSDKLAGLSVGSANSVSHHQQQQQGDGTAQGLGGATRQLLAPAAKNWLRDLPGGGFEGVIGLPPPCKPRLSTVRKAERLLSQGNALAALLQLCPASSSLLLTYAAHARNEELLKQLLVFPKFTDELEPQVFPQNYTAHGGFFALIPTVLTAAAAAVQQRWHQPLMLLLAAKGSYVSYIARPLLRLAAARSNAACLQLLITCTTAANSARVAPEHLAVAAGRCDADAEGVAALLLQELSKRNQIAAKWLRPAYAAACRSGNTDILRQLLQAAAAAAASENQPQWKQWHLRQHVLAALYACAAAGNSAVWQQLMQWFSTAPAAAVAEDVDMDSSSSLQEEDQQELRATLQGLNLSCIEAEHWIQVLHAVLPQPAPPGLQQVPLQPSLGRSSNAATVQRKLQQVADRCSMAELLWSCLQERFPASEAAVRQLLQESCSWRLLVAGTRDILLQHTVKEITEDEWVSRGQSEMPQSSEAGSCAAAAAPVGQRFAGHGTGQLGLPHAGAALAGPAAGLLNLADLNAALASGAEDVQEAGFEALMAALGDFWVGHVPTRDAALDAIVALADHLHAERLLWLQQHGLLYGRSAHEMLQHVLLAQAGRAAVFEQHGVAALYVHKALTLYKAATSSAHVRSATAGAGPAALQLVKDPRPSAANKVASLVFHSRVAAACRTGSLEALQQLEQLQNLISLMTRADGVFMPFVALHVFCPVPASAAAAVTDGTAAAAESEAAGMELETGMAAASAAANPYACANDNAAYALQLAEQLGVSGLASSMRYADNPLAQNAFKHAARQQQQPEHSAHCGPAPLWQLSLLKVFDVYPDSSSYVMADLSPALSSEADFTSAVLDAIRVQDLPNARVQALAKALAGTKHVAVGGHTTVSTPANSAAFLAHRKRMTGSLIAEFAVQRLQPQLLQWVVQQRSLFEVSLSAEDAERFGIPVIAGSAGVTRPATQSEELQRTSLAACCPLTVGLQQLAAADANAPAAAAGEVCTDAKAKRELAAVAEAAMVLLQLQPTLQPTLLSSWIGDHLHAGSSSDGGMNTSAARIARATAVLAAVAAATEVPAGAQQMTLKALQKVFVAGDVDLMAQMLLWASRLKAWEADEVMAGGEEEL